MPIYEYLCPACNRVFSFLVTSASEAREPTCPKCHRGGLRKMISSFAVTGATRKSQAATGGDNAADGDPLDDPRVEREMMKLLADADRIDENDPRQLGQLMRRMTEITGEAVEPELEEAMRRLESGEDPEAIEEDLGDFLEDGGGAGAAAGPTYDDGLYTL